MPKPTTNKYYWISNGVLQQAQSLGFTVEELEKMPRTGAGGKFTFMDLNAAIDAKMKAAQQPSQPSPPPPPPTPPPSPTPAPAPTPSSVGDEFSQQVTEDQSASKIPIQRELEPPPPDTVNAVASPNGGAPIADVTPAPTASAIDATADELAAVGRIAFERITAMIVSMATKQDFNAINEGLKADKEEAVIVQAAMAKAIRHNNIQVSPNMEVAIALAMVYGTKAIDVIEAQKQTQKQTQKKENNDDVKKQLEEQKNTAAAIYKRLEEVAAVAERLQKENADLKAENHSLLDQVTKPTEQP